MSTTFNGIVKTMYLLAILLAAHLAHSQANHPLDGLDATEITRTTSILRANGHADDSTPILGLSLEPPAKRDVLSWKSGGEISRRARAIVRRDRVNREIVIDLDADEIQSVEIVPGPGQPPLVFDELIAAIDIALGNEEMREGLLKRGVTDLEAIFCGPRTGGNFGEAYQQERRVVKVDCFDLTNNPTNVFAAPVEGLFAIVDLETREVLEVIDLGVVPVTQETWSLSVDAQEQIRDTQSVGIEAANDGNIEVDGWNVSWNNWRFHLRWDVRAGLILSTVNYDDDGTLRSVLYEGNISEIFVPYQDTSDGWYYRNYFDEGDYGLGFTHSPLMANVDCPKDAVYLTPVMANPAGGADELTNRVCLFERPTGDGAWRHFDIMSEVLDGRANVELIVRFIATVGNYDYLFDWIFDNKGQLTYRIGASGIDSVKGVKSNTLDDPNAASDTEFGPLVAPGLAGIQHSHFFSVRLDVDIDGTTNRFVRDKLVARAQPENSKRRSIWKTEREVATKDSTAKFRLSYEKPSLWRVENSSRENYLGYSTSYVLQPGRNARPLVDESDSPLSRAGFVNYHLWITPFDPEELWAAGHYSNQSLPGQGLPAWTSNSRDIEDTDIVLWYTLGFHHVPSAEDWPVYNLGWNSLTLRPYNFFDENPAMNLPEY